MNDALVRTAGACRAAAIAGLLLLAACGQPVEEDPSAIPEAAAFDPGERTTADLILTNAAVYTVNPAQPWAEAIAIGDGRILAVGTAAEVAERFSGETLDLKGAMLLPGFHDAHAHPISGGVQSMQCDLSDATTVDDIRATIGECDRAMPDTDGPEDDWLIGSGWDLSLFPAANPDKRLLDDVVGERPVFLDAADGHSGWASSAALQRAGITADTADPPLGLIERDARGEPSGTLRETAVDLVASVLPPVSDEQRRAGAKYALAMANRYGITSIVAASVDAPKLATWQALEADGGLTARVLASIRLAGGGAAADPALIEPGSRGSGRLLRLDAAKLFLDGVLEGETAALLEPYLDHGRPGGRDGTLNVPWQTLRALVTDLDARDIQVHMHAIGDRAVRQGLDAVEAARAANGPRDNRHHICHLQLVHPDDYPRFGGLGVVANFQPLWAYPDAYITEINRPAVGQGRVDRMYPIGAIAAAGGTIVGGSDWNVSSMNPLDAIETAVTRMDPNGDVSGVLNPGSAVGLDLMLAAYTANAAYVMHQEDQTGTIETGKQADLVVLDANLFEIDPAAINETLVLRTYLAGRQVYLRPARPDGA